MEITFQIYTHIYQNERIHDEVLDDLHLKSILPDSIRKKAIEYRNYHLKYQYDKATILSEVSDELCQVYGEKEIGFAFFYGKENVRYQGNISNIRLEKAIKQYLDPEETGIVKVDMMILADAGEVFRENNLRFNIYPNEKGHEAHVHIFDTQNTFERRYFLTTEVDKKVSGKPRKNDIKRYKKIIQENKEIFIKYWNEMTTGIVVDLDYVLGNVD